MFSLFGMYWLPGFTYIVRMTALWLLLQRTIAMFELYTFNAVVWPSTGQVLYFMVSERLRVIVIQAYATASRTLLIQTMYRLLK